MSLNWIRVPHSLYSTQHTVQVLFAHMSSSLSLISKLYWSQLLYKCQVPLLYRSRSCTGPVAVHVPVAVQVPEIDPLSEDLYVLSSLEFWAPNGGSVIRQQATHWPGLPPGTIEYSSICPPRSPPVSAPPPPNTTIRCKLP